jgi:hypothetical protein
MKEAIMTTSEIYRMKAAESAQFAKRSRSPGDAKIFIEAERSYTTLAENEEWMASNADKVVRAEPSRKD